LQKPDSGILKSEFYVPSQGSPLPIDTHCIGQDKRAHLMNLLSRPTKTPTHLLFYGPPGTGKTSLARRIGQDLNLPTYEIAGNSDNKSKSRRTAIIACINMTRTKKGALIIVDEADNLLNTSMSWLFSGETQDKGWLNHLLEKPWCRMIWITNKTTWVDGSVLRRFSFSMAFKPLNRHQRASQLEQVLRQNRVKRHFSQDMIQTLTADYNVSAGVMETAVSKAIDSGAKTQSELLSAVKIGLDAYLELVNKGSKKPQEKTVDKKFTLKGLNLSGNIQDILEQVDAFGEYLNRVSSESAHQMSLLFYGPPGAGKTEMARYIGHRLLREILFRCYSQLQSKYLGEGERNIREAFERAQAQNNILVIDEVESVLFSRSRARHSWEISFTNEFLTAIERFRGLLVCTTNRMRDLDTAALRRFTHKIKFGYLDAKGNNIFFNQILAPMIIQRLTLNLQKRLANISYLTPGDFKTVRDQFAFYPEEKRTALMFVQALEKEARIKAKSEAIKKIGFNTTAVSP
jgi:SpoVK/Ycf46/Vps4 family AAA+-type ATPase